MSDEPQSTTAWAKGADGERRLARRLTDDLVAVGITLHDRKVPGTKGNIDHLVVAPSGVWVIDAKNYAGKVERRDVGGWLSTDLRLYVANHNKTNLVHGMGWQVKAVQTALSAIGFGELPIHPVLCFTDAEWGIFAKPFEIDGVLVTWAAKLIEAAKAPGPCDPTVIDLVARHLSATFPAST